MNVVEQNQTARKKQNHFRRYLCVLMGLLWVLPALRAGQIGEGPGEREKLQARYRQVSDWRIAFNVGALYLREEKPLKAKIWFMRAWRNSLGTDEAVRALRYLERWFPRSPESPLKEPALVEVWGTASIRLVSHGVMKGLGLVLSALISLLLFLGFRRGWGRMKTHLLVALVLLAIVWAALMVLRLWDTRHPRMGLVFRDTWVTSAPSEEGTPLVMIAPGQEVTVMERQGAWIQVKWGEYAGWAQKSGVEVIP